jgi:DNA topoisomerase-1
MDYQFTARMEEQLDDIADTSGEWKPMLREFYAPFEQRLTHARDHMPAMKQAETIARDCPVCGGQLVIKYGRFGKFIGCSNHPQCTHTEPYLELTGVSCPKCGTSDGGELVERKTRKGRTFYGCSRYPACDFSAWQLPKTAKSTPDDDYEPEEMQDIAG